ncbi:MHYT domain-containing protein [Rhizobium sp. SSA_523]|uniref:MHYT domain-containing protein n=1 Tax=Rhizobium sp. SSA_523 TaxID=2952477 RepID=UPI002090FE73|nr:MHYT domain-containing protein [Rhizobium sp. SSA_523]MCO5731347.1 PAS domain S-box protein [Rhizobium sp. SSA_523]WKC22123.1 MHYT domain-containing protein [Rhizobium sp. SSA_523]
MADGALGSHNSLLMILAVLVAIAASYTALDLAQRISAAPTKLGSTAWLATAAVCMGGGIWSMHFIAMLAYSVSDAAIAYDPFLTLLSLLIAVLATGGGFAVVSRPSTGPMALILSGLFMGGGVLAMHYIGMAAMRLNATLSYAAGWVAVSAFIAIGAAIAALWLAFRGGGVAQKGLSALAMGLAISGMHFAGMRAASFGAHQGPIGSEGPAGVDQGSLALSVAAITFLILLAAIVAAMFDRRFAALATKEALALKRSEEQFRLMYRRTPLPLHSLDEEGQIEDVSDAWLSLLGYDRAAVIGRPLINFMTEASARQRVKDWQTLRELGELREQEYRLVTRSGEFIDVLSTSRIERDQDGRFLRAVGGLVDVTARRKAEEALRQAQKMEAVGQLTGGIAHDFNNVLAIILGSLEMIRKRVPEDPRVIRMVDNALEGAKRGAALTQRMLSFARRQSLMPQAVDPLSLVEGMRDMLEKSLGPRLSLLVQVPPGLAPVQADPHQLEMALLNLVVNARDAMEDGFITITSEPDRKLPARLGKGRFACLSVIDQGTGMDEETLSRAQEPFFTTKGVGQGTGLGLSMVSGFAEQSGGMIDIRSRVGEGTRVDIWLPLAAEDALPDDMGATAPDRPDQPLQNRTVLVVDDEPLILMTTAATLREAGARVLSAATAMEALEVVRRNPGISCVLTDYAMPGMTGAQLAAAIRVKLPGLPVIIATGYADVPEEISGYGRLQKPFTEADLLETIAVAVAPLTADIIPFPPQAQPGTD